MLEHTILYTNKIINETQALTAPLTHLFVFEYSLGYLTGSIFQKKCIYDLTEKLRKGKTSFDFSPNNHIPLFN
jgi:hypothetical protein